MAFTGRGKGRLIVTGQSRPVFKVYFDIGHISQHSHGTAAEEETHVEICAISSEDGVSLPLGDFDLIADEVFLRLRHSSGVPEWLVMSSNAMIE